MIFKKIYLLVLSALSINMVAMDELSPEQLNSLWDIVEIAKFKLKPGFRKISKDNLYICSCKNNELYYFNIETYKNKTILFTHKILHFALTPNNKYIICALENSEVIIWDIENWKLHQYKIIEKPIEDLICSSSNYFAIITKENIIFIINIESGEIIYQTYPMSDKSHYTDFKFSHDSQYFSVIDYGLSIIWPINCISPIVHDGDFLGFSEDSEWIFIRRTNELFCQNINTKYFKLLKFDGSIERIISTNNQLIISIFNDKTSKLTIYLSNILTTEKKEIFSIPYNYGSSFSWNLTNNKLIIISDDQILKILDLNTFEIINTINMEVNNALYCIKQTFINHIYADDDHNNNFAIFKIIDPSELTQEQQILLYELKRNPKPLILNKGQKEVFKTLPWYVKKLYVGKIKLFSPNINATLIQRHFKTILNDKEQYKKFIRKSTELKVLKDEKKNGICAICQEGNTDMLTACCRGRFHLACLIPKLTENATCPTCRESLSLTTDC